ncbi:hypothetical protein NC652_006776 [Populus alba x Populus x berolinensis]|nr:hypothetical protein NC652_006776 [Populus alba x Populus x berolinensis]
MLRGSNSDLFDPRTEMDSDFTRGSSASDGDFGLLLMIVISPTGF